MADTNPEGYKFIDITDFSPGIVDDEFSAATSDHSVLNLAGLSAEGAGAVAAQVDGTYRCIADRTGALVPLPKATAGSETMTPPGTLTAPTYYPTTQAAVYLLDALMDYCPDDAGEADVGIFPTDPHGMIALWGFNYDTGGNGAVNGYKGYVLGRAHWGARPAGVDWDWFFQRDQFAYGTTDIRPMSFGGVERSLNDPGTPIADQMSSPTFGIAWMVGKQRALMAVGAIGVNDAALTTYDTDVSANFVNTSYGLVSVLALSTGAMSTSNGVGGAYGDFQLLVAHQGRVVGFFSDERLRRFGVYYSDVRSPYAALNGQYMWVEENGVPVGAAASMNASELLVIRDYGGGFMVRGDVANPTIVRLPKLESTHGVISRGVVCPIGFVYLTDTGVYVWDGGDTSKKLSTQIDGPVWEYRSTPANEPTNGYVGRLECWDGKVFIPNNYLYDTVGGGWWRLDLPSNYSNIAWSHYNVSPRTGDLYAFPYKIAAASQPVWYEFDRATLASSYSWKSQPLVQTRRDLINFCGVELKAVAASDATVSSITITLTGYDRNGVALTPATWTISDLQENGRLTYREADIVNFEARYVVLKIEASSSTGPAPKVLGLRFHTTDGNMVVKG